MSTSLGLEPWEARRFQVLAEVGSDVPTGQSVALEAYLIQSDERVAGALGMVLLGPDE
ncbi:hypothetical protein [Streptomyces sp. NPDC001678]|uniref:hypothetical protein n=1 Tax=Streptomyces sp. NPDC001678 TaxID=3364599 RepID=UPI00369DC4BB